MKANPGGQIDSDAVIGRNRLIKNIWEILGHQSLVMTAERRIGKTTVLKKMRDEPHAGWVPVYQDLERCHSAMDFAMLVYKEIDQFLSRQSKVARRAKQFFAALGGVEVGGVVKLPEMARAPWKDVLAQSVEDLTSENDAAGTKLLFLWDEMPFMLMNIRDREGEQTAMEVLDLLRALRQTHPGLRMLITGSIGLHHVLASLRDHNYANSPLNDMAKVDVPPLEVSDAVKLAGLLMEGEGLRVSDNQAASAMARDADCFPYYIHHIARALKIRGLDANSTDVAEVVATQLVDPNDPWDLTHYRDRIPRYYPDDRNAVLLILDELAAGNELSSVRELLDMLKGSIAFDDRERLLGLLSLMERDHYLRRDTEGRYSFRFSLIRRWWKINRGL